MHTRIGLVFALLIVFLVYNVTGNIAFADTHATTKTTIFITDCSGAGACLSPCQVTILRGDTITWVNSGRSIHMITSGSSQSGADGWFASQIISPHGTFSHKFDRAGPFVYFDNLHPSLTGVVIVEKALGSTQTSLQQSFFSNWCSR